MLRAPIRPRSLVGALLLAGLFLSASLLATSAAAAQGDDLGRLDRELRRLAAKVRPSVVAVRVVATGEAVPEESASDDDDSSTVAAVPTRRVIYRASGLVASGKGEVITIIGEALLGVDLDPQETLGLEIDLDDGTTTTAQVIGTDPETGIALLKMDSPPRKLRPVRFSRRSPELGATVISVGARSFALGIVAHPARGVSLGGASFPRGIVTTIDAQPGDVGGMLANAEGDLVGILAFSLVEGRETGVFEPEPSSSAVADVDRHDPFGGSSSRKGPEVGVVRVMLPKDGGPLGSSVAIPADLLLRIVTQLREVGEVTRGALGASFKLYDPGCEAGHIGAGAQVLALTPGGTAERAGLRIDDVIQRVEGRPVKRAGDLLWFREIVEYGEIGRSLTLRIARRQGSRVVAKEIRVPIGTRAAIRPVGAGDAAVEEPAPTVAPEPLDRESAADEAEASTDPA